MSIVSLSRASRNSSWMLLGQVAAVAASFVFTLYAARILGAHGFGQYAFALTLTSFLTLAASLGLDVLLIRSLARDFTRAGTELGAAIGLRTVLWLVGMAVLLVAVHVLPTTEGARVATLILGLSVLPVLLTGCATAVMAAREHLGSVAIVNAGANLLRTGLGLLVLHLGMGVIGVAWATVCGAVLGSIVAFIIVIRRYELHFGRARARQLKEIAWRAAPFGAAGLLFTLYFRLNVMVLGLWRGDGDVGLYAACFKFPEAFVLIPGSVLAATFPILSRLHGTDDHAFGQGCRFLSRLILVIGIPIAALIAARPAAILGWLYGAEYTIAASTLAVVIWLAPLLGLNWVLGNALFAAGRPKDVLRTELIGVLASIATALLLIPRWGPLGAAIGVVFTSAVVVIRNTWSLRTERAATPSWDVIFPALPVALLIGLIYRNVPLSVPAGFVGGLLLYGIVFVLAGGVRPHERAWLAANLPEGTVRRVCRHLRLLDEKTHGDGSIPIDITENADARRP